MSNKCKFTEIFRKRREERLQNWKALRAMQVFGGINQPTRKSKRLETRNDINNAIIDLTHESESEVLSPKKETDTNQSEKHATIVATQTVNTYVSKPVSDIKRMILIDGNDVALCHSRNQEFSVEGIAICLNYFLEKGYDAIAIVPQIRFTPSKTSNPDLLAKLEKEGKVVSPPWKILPNGQYVESDKGRFILDIAEDFDAAVISNDQYSDLSRESEKYRHIICTRVIGFAFLNDFIRFPQDPYGRYGPSLNEILNRKGKA